MTKKKCMWIDVIDRTRELLCHSRVSHEEIAFLTGLNKRWIDGFKSCSDESARRQDASLVERLHDWLIILEVAEGPQRFEPAELLMYLGESAIYLYRQRQSIRSDGLFPTMERETILRAASAQLRDMRHGLSQV